MALPTLEYAILEPALFRVLLLRRLRAPPPLATRHCRCSRPLDDTGDHRAACNHAGVLGARGAALERAGARVCREAGARVQTNVYVRDLNLDGRVVQDDRRLEIVANGLPLWSGAQLAVDTTLVCPLRRDGSAQPRAANEDGACANRSRGRK